MDNKLDNSKRKYISIGTTMSFLVLLFSGIALYLAPNCRVADAIGWRFCFLDKESLESVHITFSLVFIILSILHVMYNWKALVSYLRNGFGVFAGLNRAVVISGAVTVLLFVMSVFRVPPVGWLHGAHEYIKFSWGPNSAERDGDPLKKSQQRRGRYQRGE